MADYKFETLTSETVAWTTPFGNVIEINVSLVQESTDFFGQGDWLPVRGGLTVKTVTKVAGLTHPTAWVQEVKGHEEYTHRIGVIGLSADQLQIEEIASS